MDKGAARSKKRQDQLEKAAKAALIAQEAARLEAKKSSSKSKSKSKLNRNPSDDAGPSTPRPPLEKKKRPAVEEQSKDPELYKAKAIRGSQALVWPCELPPASLEGITRVDLTNSGVIDVEWLRGSGVRWLSVSECAIKDWEPVGSLTELTVLNMNECGLTKIPRELSSLKKLKALVAMSNPWKTLDSDIISSWPELNSLIISHSPNLTSIPDLSTLIHLSKLTFSHCPRISSTSLPDITALPLLRDVKMNNLPLLTSLPSHVLSWGTGPMSSLDASDSRLGLGLESLDVGSCSLDEKSLSTFKSARLPALRSLTLHHNPLASSKPNYVELLQGYGSMPKLQIVDNKRVVEKKTHTAVPKKNKNKSREKEKRAKPTGTNDVGEVKMRQWGDGKVQEGEDVVIDGERRVKGYTDRVKGDTTDKKRKRSSDKDEADEDITEAQKPSQPAGPERRERKKKNHDAVRGKEADGPAGKRSKHDEDSAAKPQLPKSTLVPAATAPSAKTLDPSALTSDKSHRHSQNETGVYGVVEVGQSGGEKVKAAKGKKGSRKDSPKVEKAVSAGTPSGGIDLKAMFNKPSETGLGVGGW